MSVRQLQLERRVLSRNIDMLTLHFCQKPMTGYDLIGEIQKTFGVRLSAGLVYHSLMRLERDGMLSHRFVDGRRKRMRARSYEVTVVGEMFLLNLGKALGLLKRVVFKEG